MTLAVDITHRLGAFALDARFEADGTLIALLALIASEWFARRAGMRYHGD